MSLGTTFSSIDLHPKLGLLEPLWEIRIFIELIKMETLKDMINGFICVMAGMFGSY
jgi:hypothetical protein